MPTRSLCRLTNSLSAISQIALSRGANPLKSSLRIYCFITSSSVAVSFIDFGLVSRREVVPARRVCRLERGILKLHAACQTP